MSSWIWEAIKDNWRHTFSSELNNPDTRSADELVRSSEEAIDRGAFLTGSEEQYKALEKYSNPESSPESNNDSMRSESSDSGIYDHGIHNPSAYDPGSQPYTPSQDTPGFGQGSSDYSGGDSGWQSW